MSPSDRAAGSHDPGDTLAPGSRFENRYEVLAELGSGSFGRVYKARQLSTGQLVAVKVLRLTGEGDSESRSQRFRRETQLCAELSHPNIVRLIDSGETAEGKLYATFEFVPGATLREVLAAEGKLEAAESARLMAQVLDAMACAHAAGIVHRDLKPENIMVTKTGVRRNALVLDFGLGGLVLGAQGLTLAQITATRDLLGTPCYAAPEQLRGEPTSASSDLYSWGLIFLECLTGELAVRGASPQEVIQKQLGPDPVLIPPWLRSHPLGRVLEMVTSKRADRREVSIEALLRILETVGIGGLSESSQRQAEQTTVQERRQLTIVCCRFVGSRETGEQLSAEESDERLQARQVALSDRAARHGGSLATVTGERAFVVFGYPHAHEDDARRAARLAREVVTEGQAVDALRRLDVQVGIHTGLVVVPNPGSSGIAHLHDLAGLTPEIAGRLAEHAEAAEIFISADTHRLLWNELECAPAGELAVSELSRPITVFRLLGRQPRDLAIGSGVLRPETPLVGRASQLEQLLDGWARAAAGSGGATIMIGEAGIGKSRLLRELRRRAGMDGWIEWRCAPENQTAPLRPVIDFLLATDRSIEALLSRLGLDLAENLPLFAPLLSLPLDAAYAPLQLSTQRQKELTLQAIIGVLFRVAEERPTVLAIENLHWADPTTLELTALLVQELRAARYVESESGPKLFVVFTTRPELVPTWAGEDIALLPLQRLTRVEVEEMVRAGIGSQATFTPPLLEMVVRRAEGVPLFVEEVTRVVMASTRPGGAASGQALDPSRVEIPGSLRDLLTARLDGVSGAARETAQLAAVLGREFRLGILQELSSKHPTFLREDMAELGQAGLVFRRRGGSGDSYSFRHALIRDAAYEAMTRVARQAVHRRVANVLRERFPEVERSRPEILALHCEQGGEVEAAVDYWARAGNESYGRAAYAEALSQFERGLELVRSLERSADNQRREIDLLVGKGTTLFSTRGWAVPEVEETFDRAWNLSKEFGTDPPLTVLYGVWAVRITRSDPARVEALFPGLRVLAARTDDPMSAHFGHSCLGIGAFWRGDFLEAGRHLEEALRYYSAEHEHSAYDGGLYSYAFGLLTLWLLGFPERAQAVRSDLFAIAERRHDPYSKCCALAYGAILAHDAGDRELAGRWSEELMALAEEQRLFAWWAPGAIHYGRTLPAAGRAEEGIQLIRQGLDRQRLLGINSAYNYYLYDLASAYLEAGHLQEAETTIEESLALCRSLMSRAVEPEILRLRGRLRLKQADTEAGEESFRAALAMAERDGALAYALRSATDLAGLLTTTGRSDQATAILAPIHGRFTEGLDTHDLQQASALLQSLSRPDAPTRAR